MCIRDRCDVMPDIDEDVDVQINDDDLRIDTYRSRGCLLYTSRCV